MNRSDLDKSGDALQYWMDRQVAEVPVWTEPEAYDRNVAGDRRQMYGRVVMDGARVIHKVAEIADDLFELHHPDQKNDQVARQRFVEPIIAEGDHFGIWHYFKWSNSLVQYPDAETHRQLLTFRNRELITADELRKLGTVTTAHVGLSVGSHILEQTSHMALGRKVILADPDIVSVMNLNRINAGMPEVGMRKTDVAGIKLSELNPYVKQIHQPDGITPDNAHLFEHHKPDLIYEEVDHMPTKILMRRVARKARAAVIMAGDIGDKSMIDIERFDLEERAPFLDRLTANELALIETGALPTEQNLKLMFKHIGPENISRRLAVSIGQIGVTLGGIAQLGTTASAGAAYAAVAGREIVLGRGPQSGRYRLSPQDVFGVPYL